MKFKKRRSLEVPPKIKSFIDNVTSTPLENIVEPLGSFFWEFDKGDFNHWIDLFNHFDLFFERFIKPRKDLRVEENFWEPEFPFPREPLLQVLRVSRIILENCSNKHLYSSYEQHLSSLLASTDPEVIEASLQTLAAFIKRNIGKYSLTDASLSSKLFSFAQGWGGKEEGLGLIASSVPDGCNPVAYELGCTLHFEFYVLNDSEEPCFVDHATHGLQIIHLPNVNCFPETDLELLEKLVQEHKVPPNLRFSLLTRLRFARAFDSLASRQQYTCMRLYAFIVLVQTSNEADDLVSFFHSEPEFVNELVALLSYEDVVSEKIRILCLLSLVALSQDRSRQPTVLSAITSGGHRGIISSLMQKAIKSVLCESSKWSVVFAEALLSLVTVLVSSSSGCSAMHDAGFLPTLLPLLKDTSSHHLHLVATAVQNLEAFMDYSNPAALLFRELGGLEDTICRLKIEVSFIEGSSKQELNDCKFEGIRMQYNENSSLDLENIQPFYSDSLVSYHRRLLIKALLRAISHGTYAPGNSTRVCGSEESVLPYCLCVIFRRAKDFGGGVFSLAASVMIDLIHKDPTCYAVLDTAGIPSAFLDAIINGVVCSAEAIKSIPPCLDALCLNNNGLQIVKDRNALRCFIKIFTSKSYLRALTSEATGSLSSGLDELMRHASSLRAMGVDVLIDILNSIAKIGSGVDMDVPSTSTSIPMETDAEDKVVHISHSAVSKVDHLNQITEHRSDCVTLNVESFLPDLVTNIARLLETVLQNADTCRLFVDKKGVEAVLQLFTLPLMPLSASVGQSISIAFKNFSQQHSSSFARSILSFLREHGNLTNDVLASLEGVQLASLESALQTKVLRHLSCLDGLLSLSIFLLKGMPNIITELSVADADFLKDLGTTYKEVVWQMSLCNDSKVDETRQVERETDCSDGASSSSVGREADDHVNIPAVRYTNPISSRNNSQSIWGGDRDFISAFRSGDGLHRRSRHGLARIRGGRVGRHMDALNIDSEAHLNVSEKSFPETRKKSPDVLILEILNRLISIMRTFFTAIVKSFTSPIRRRTDAVSLSSASKILATTLGKVFFDALSFSGYCTSGRNLSPSVKCRYLGKVVDDMGALIFDSRRRSCYGVMVNSFYVHETFKELLTTFEATSQLLWTSPYLAVSRVDNDKADGKHKPSHSSWLLETLKCYCRVLEYFVNSSLLLSSTSTSHAQLLVQPVAVGLSIGLFPVPKNPEAFVRILQSQVLDVILPIWNNPMLPNCCPGFIASVMSLITHVYAGVGDVKRSRNGATGGPNQRHAPQPLDESTITTIVEMGFSRSRAEEALRHVETNSVEMAMEWLFSHMEDPIQEDDELARALALSLGNNSEGSKVEAIDKPLEISVEGLSKEPPVDNILYASVKFFQSCDAVSFAFADLLGTLCNRSKGEDRMKVTSYLIQQLKYCPLEFSTDSSTLCMLSHASALLLYEDETLKRIACQNGIISVVLDILIDFRERHDFGCKIVAPKCISSLLLILDNMLHSKPRPVSDTGEGTQTRILGADSHQVSSCDEKMSFHFSDKDSGTVVDKMLGNSTGYLTMEESQRLLIFVCELMKHRIPAMVMQSVLQLCAHLTKTHALSLQFLDNGGLVTLFNLPRTCFFPGYDTVASSIIRHLLEDPQTLQTAMELEIKQILSGAQSSGRITPRSFLTSMAPVISRDPLVFMKAATSICHLESSGGRDYVVLSKEKEKEKEKLKISVGEDGIKIAESKMYEGTGKCFKSHKKVPANLMQVIDQLLDIVLRYYPVKEKEEPENEISSMEVDEPAKAKGKSKVNDSCKLVSESDRSAGLAKVTFVLKLLSDIVLMYAHAVGVILRRDVDLCQFRSSNQADRLAEGGILHHILHKLLPISCDKSAGSDEWRNKLSEKASWFLVVLCSRSGEGRRRLVAELVRAMSVFSCVESNSSDTLLLPNKSFLAFADLVHSLLSKSTSSSNLPGSGFSPEMAKSMIDGGMVQCLTGFLQKIDLDHPDAPKIVNLLVKALESLTRAANSGDQLLKSEGGNKRKSASSNGRLDDHTTLAGSDTVIANQNRSGTEGCEDEEAERRQRQRSTSFSGSHDAEQFTEQDMRIEMEEPTATNVQMEIGSNFMQEEMEDGGILHHADQIEMTFQVENRADDDMGDEDDEMGDDGEEDEDEDDGEEEDEDLAEDGGGMISLADTDVEDHDDPGLVDDYNDEIVDEDDEDFHVNRVIEVRWREALDGLDRLQVLGQPGAASALLESEPFEGVNVHDLFSLRRSLGFERQRQSRAIERSITEVNGFQHPLLVRPSQSVDILSSWSSSGHASRDLESTSSGTFDVANFYMFDAPVLPADHFPSSIFTDRLGYPMAPPLGDFLVGMDSVQIPGRRGPGDSRWTDDGQPQVGSQAAVVAQALEVQFLRELRDVSPANGSRRHNAELEKPESGAEPPNIQPMTDDSDKNFQHAEISLGNGIENSFDQPADSVSLLVSNSQIVQDGGRITGIDSEAMVCHSLSHNSTHIRENNIDMMGSEGVSRDIADGLPEAGNLAMENCGLLNSQTVDEGPHSAVLTPVVQVSDIPSQEGNENFLSCQLLNRSGFEMSNVDGATADFNMVEDMVEGNQSDQPSPAFGHIADQVLQRQELVVPLNDIQVDQNTVSNANSIDPTFLEALPEDLRAELLASRQTQPLQPPAYVAPSVDDIDPDFLAALPLDIQAEILAQQRAERIIQQAEGQPVDMDNASIIATFPADLREEVLLTSSEAVISALPSPLLAEAQLLRDRAMSHYHARSLFGSTHRLTSRRNGLGLDRHTVIDRGVGVSIGRRAVTPAADTIKVNDVDGHPLLDADALQALIRLLRLAQPLGKGLLQRLLLNLCAHSATREMLVRILLDMIKPEAEGSPCELATINSQRLYGCQSNVVYGRSQFVDGLPPLVLRRILEIFTYLATNHSSIAHMLFYLDSANMPDSYPLKYVQAEMDKGKGSIEDGRKDLEDINNVPLVLFLKLLNRPKSVTSVAHLEQVMVLLQVVVHSASSKLEGQLQTMQDGLNPQNVLMENGPMSHDPGNLEIPNPEISLDEKAVKTSEEKTIVPDGKNVDLLSIFLKLPQHDLRNLCSLLGRECLSEKVYMLAGEVLKKLASVAMPHRNFFTSELSKLTLSLSSTAVSELLTLKNTNMLGLSAASMAGAATLRVLQALSSLNSENDGNHRDIEKDSTVFWDLNMALDPLWRELSDCISVTEMQLGQNTSPILSSVNGAELLQGASFPPVPPGIQRLLPFIEAFFVLCEKLQPTSSYLQQDHGNVTAREIKESAASCSSQSNSFNNIDCQRKLECSVTFSRFAERHRRLLNTFIRQNPNLLDKSLSIMLKAPRLIDFDNKRAYFRSRIRQHHEQHLSGPLRISVRRAYILEDSYNQLRMRSSQDLRGRLNVQFQGEEGIDAGGLTREWYQLLSRVIFDKGALLFTTVGNNATFQPNPNSVYQTEHLSYFKFVGRVVAKALFDGQLLDVYFTRSFYKHILGVKVTYHDIEAVDPDYYKNLKWMLENDVNDLLDLTFSMDPDEEKHILYEKAEVTDYELKPGGRNIKVTEETKHEYVDLVADHILTNAIRPQINSFLEGFNELVPRELISIFNDKELELLISGLPEIDLEDLKANSEYSGYTAASDAVQWFWEVVKDFGKEDRARLLQFVTGTSKVPLEGFKALQGISGPQRFQIHRAYGAPERLPSAHTCFNQLDLPEYSSKDQLQERLLLAIHEASEGFGFG